MKKLNGDDIVIEHVFHLSDIHIRLYHRLEDEYEHVFARMYDLLEESKKNQEECLIVLTGDILHNKNDLSPECIMTTLRFLNTLSSYYPTIIIAGNHDTLLNNLNRIDSLSAILVENKNPQLHYLKYSGLYQYGNIVFGVSSLLDNQMIPAPTHLETLTKIALYHGGVGKFRTNKGFQMEGIPLHTFDGYDMVMLGDIHLHQYLDKDRRIAYAGSMIAQNFGETDPHHGVLKWNVATRQSELILLENPYRYCEAILQSGKLWMDDCLYDLKTCRVPEKARVKLILQNKKTPQDIQDIRKLQKKFPCVQFLEKVVPSTGHDDNKKKEQHNPVISTTTHDVVLQTFFDTLPIDRQDKEKLREIILSCLRQDLPTTSFCSHFDVLCLEFEYMFGYGAQNKIDFSTMPKNETLGVFGSNSAGKSTLIEILLFLLFGTITRYKHGQSTPHEVIHFQQKKSWGMVRFQSHNSVYEVHKTMIRTKTRVRVEEKLFKIQKDGTKLDLSEEHRRKTDKFVISQIGTCSQFLFTNVFLQSNEQSFRSMSPKDRKDFLYDILGLSSLEEHYQHYFTTWKEQKNLLETLEKELKSMQVSSEEVEQTRASLRMLKETRRSYEQDLTQIQKDIRIILSSKKACPLPLDELTRQIQTIQSDMKEKTMTTYQDPEKYRKQLWKELEELYPQRHVIAQEDVVAYRQWSRPKCIEKKRITSTTINVDDVRKKKEELLSQLYPVKEDTYYTEDEILLRLEEIQQLPSTKQIEQQLAMAESELLQCKPSDAMDLGWEFDPECQCCLHNQTVLHKNCPEQKKQLKQKVSQLRQQLRDVQRMKEEGVQWNHILSNRKIQEQVDSIQQQLQEHKDHQHELRMVRVGEDIQHNLEVDQQIQDKKTILRQVDTQLDFATKKKKLDELREWNEHGVFNQKADQQVCQKEQEESMLKTRLAKVVEDYIRKKQELLQWEKQLKIKKQKEEEYKETQDKHGFLEKLLSILHRDGLPMYFLEQSLPTLEQRVNELIAPFLQGRTIVLKKEQKKETCNILLHVSTLGSETVYLGGMEGFIVDASIKEALAEVSLHSKSNLFIIDEGISALDKKQMENLDQFFHFLEERHPHVLVISHLQEVSHLVRHSFRIEKKDVYSQLVYS